MRLSFRQVFETHDRISIPLLQRDYAHGRDSASEVRSRFVEVLRETLELPVGDPRLPLDLDFVYGSPESDGEFCPLDGQQRLTTLFLLHWYLATRDGAGAVEDFRSWASKGRESNKGRESRFSYRVRPSSTDFFDALVVADIDLDALLKPDQPDALSRTLEDQAWFFQSWQLDPTIRSCLVVLDTIHARFADTRGRYERMVLSEVPAITFQFLDLRNFGLTDDLYIKMNARGKELTTFEAFKANFERYVHKTLPDGTQVLNGSELSTHNYVAQRFDTQWCDLFWRFRGHGRSHDLQTMNAIRSVALVAWIGQSDLHADKEINRVLQALRDGALHSFYDYLDAGCLSEDFVYALIHLFDRWSQDGDAPKTFLASATYYDEKETFRRILLGEVKGRESVNYSEWVQYVAWCEYLLSGRPVEGLHEWMRVITNLSGNTVYNRVDEFRVSLLGLRKLLRESEEGLLEQLQKLDAVPGFNRQQVREERLKAQLLLRYAHWRPLIEEAETHSYFRGQIEFLFSFSGILERWLADECLCSWSEPEDVAFRSDFAEWLAKAKAVFSGSNKPGLRPLSDFLWERALLCEGDYLLSNNTNHGFLDDRDREMSWKRLLRSDLQDQTTQRKRDILGAVLAGVDVADVEGSLRTRINQGVSPQDEAFPGWRERLVEFPELIEYCSKRQLRMVQDGAIYLLSKVRRSGWHLELFSAYLAHRIGPSLEKGILAPFDTATLHQVMTDSIEPELVLTSSVRPELRCSLTYWGGLFHLDVPESLRPEAAQKAGPWTVTPDRIETELEAMAARAR